MLLVDWLGDTLDKLFTLSKVELVGILAVAFLVWLGLCYLTGFAFWWLLNWVVSVPYPGHLDILIVGMVIRGFYTLLEFGSVSK